VILVII